MPRRAEFRGKSRKFPEFGTPKKSEFFSGFNRDPAVSFTSRFSLSYPLILFWVYQMCEDFLLKKTKNDVFEKAPGFRDFSRISGIGDAAFFPVYSGFSSIWANIPGADFRDLGAKFGPSPGSPLAV